MIAISLHQPWASLVAHGLKQYETRSWPIHYRGPLAIHATKRKPTLYPDSQMHLIRAVIDMGFRTLGALPYGCVVCTVEVTDCLITDHAIKQLSPQEISFGNYAPGRFAWRLDNLQSIPNVPAVGHQGLWHWEPPT